MPEYVVMWDELVTYKTRIYAETMEEAQKKFERGEFELVPKSVWTETVGNVRLETEDAVQ